MAEGLPSAGIAKEEDPAAEGGFNAKARRPSAASRNQSDGTELRNGH